MPSHTVLFVCVHNAGRSQMAAAYLRAMSDERVQVLSAGSAPAEEVNPHVVAVMAEDGIDLAQAVPRKLDVENVKKSDVVITMGCGDACPVFPGKRYFDWQVDDPADQNLDQVRLIRDDIKSRVQELLTRVLA